MKTNKKLTKFDVGPIYLISYLLQLVLQSVVLMWAQSKYGDGYGEVPAWTIAIVGVNGLSFLAATYGYSMAKRINFLSESGTNKKPNLKLTLLIVPISVFTICTTMPLANWFVTLFARLGYDLSSASISMPTDVGAYLLMSLFLSLVPAICEETLFRGAVALGLRRMGAATSILVSAAMFAVMHGNPVQLVHQFGIGVVLAVVMLVSGDIKYCMLFHFLNNMISCLTSLCFPALDNIEFAAWQIPVGLAVMAAGIYCLTFTVRKFARISSDLKTGEKRSESIADALKNTFNGIVGIFKKGGLKAEFDKINVIMCQVSPDMDNDGVDDEVYEYSKTFPPLLVASFVILVVMWIANTAMGF